jgi:WD40 repeat protein
VYVCVTETEGGGGGPIQTRRPVRRLVGHSDFVKRAVAVAPWVVATTSSDATVRLWDVRTGHVAAVLKGHRRGVEAVAVLPGAPPLRLATGASDGQLRVWHADTPTWTARELGAHHTSIYDLVVQPSAHADAPALLWSASADKTVQARAIDVRASRVQDRGTAVHNDDLGVYHGQTGDVVQTLPHADWVRALAVTADGQLVTAGHDLLVRVWDPEVRSGPEEEAAGRVVYADLVCAH